jgi:hypothetical protein
MAGDDSLSLFATDGKSGCTLAASREVHNPIDA